MHVQDAGVVDDVLQKTSYVQKIAAELLDTERKYVEKLHLVDQVLVWCYSFLKNLKSQRIVKSLAKVKEHCLPSVFGLRQCAHVCI